MKERNHQTSVAQEKENPIVNHGHGSQGVDKDPEEETSEDNVQFTQQTQKGKKVDGDPSKKSDQPNEQDI